MSRLSSLGTGLLLGAALGVIIPEYVRELFIQPQHQPNRTLDIVLPGASKPSRAVGRRPRWTEPRSPCRSSLASPSCSSWSS
jgi:hypothetical protein